MCRKFELSEDQEFDLIVNITGKKVKEHVPPKVLLVHNAFHSSQGESTTTNPPEEAVISSNTHSDEEHTISSPVLKKNPSFFGRKFNMDFKPTPKAPSAHQNPNSLSSPPTSTHPTVSMSLNRPAALHTHTPVKAMSPPYDDDDFAVL